MRRFSKVKILKTKAEITLIEIILIFCLLFPGPSNAVKVLTMTKGWNSCVFSAKNVLRKEEHDWKMVYLARTEETDKAVIEWKVDVSGRKLSIKEVHFDCDTKVYENGRIQWEYVLSNGKWGYVLYCIHWSSINT